MRPLTDSCPKPLLRAGGHALIEYALQALVAAGITDIVVNLAWQGHQLRAFLQNGAAWHAQLRYSDEGPEALETGGGIHHALPILGTEPFWLANGDVYCEYPFSIRALEPGVLAHLVMVPNPEHHPGGDFCLRDGRIVAGDGPRHTYSGLAIIHPQLLAGQSAGKYPLAPLLVRAIAAGAVSGELYTGYWTDVGTPARLESLDRELRARAYTSR